MSAPWRDTPREDDKTRLFRYVRYAPEGTPLSKVVRDVFGPESVETADADYQLARRFYDRHDCFKTDRRGGLTWVYPTGDAFHLNRSKQSAGNGDGAGFGRQTVGRTPSDGSGGRTGTGVEDVPAYAKDRARSLLSKVSGIDADGLRADVLGELGTELGDIAEKFVWLERVRGSGPEDVLVPYSTRFNSPEKVGEIQRKFHRAIDRGEERYESACLATVTTDRKRFGSVVEAVEDALSNKGRLMDRLDYDAETGPPRPGYRVPHVYVPEFTDTGLIHLHIVFYGLNFLYPQSALSAMWSDLGQGEVVDVRALRKRGGEFYLPRRTGDRPGSVRDAGRGAVRVRDYLSKTLRDLDTLAGMDPADVETAVGETRRGEGGDLWKVALYWATDLRFWNGSPEFTRDDREGVDVLPPVPCYRYVGTARLEGIPGYVRERAVIFTRRRRPPRPPPDAPDPPSTATGATSSTA